MIIYVVRHGEVPSKDKIISGCNDEELTKKRNKTGFKG